MIAISVGTIGLMPVTNYGVSTKIAHTGFSIESPSYPAHGRSRIIIYVAALKASGPDLDDLITTADVTCHIFSSIHIITSVSPKVHLSL